MTADMFAAARVFQAAMTAQREAWTAHPDPPPGETEEDEPMAKLFTVPYPAKATDRVACQQWMHETYLRTGRPAIPAADFIRSLADAGEEGGTGEADTSGLSRDDQLLVRRILHAAEERCRLYAPDFPAPVAPLARALLSAWEGSIAWRPPSPNAPTDCWGEQVRPGGGPPVRVA